VKRRKKRSVISRHRKGKVKESKTRHLPVPPSERDITTLPRVQATPTKQSIQRKLDSSNRKIEALRENTEKLQMQKKVMLAELRSVKHDAWKEKKASNATIQAVCDEAAIAHDNAAAATEELKTFIVTESIKTRLLLKQKVAKQIRKERLVSFCKQEKIKEEAEGHRCDT
jgi:TolA-binding protein